LQEIGPLDPVSSLQQQPQQQQQLTAASATKPGTGTISGMLADFSKALGEFMLSMMFTLFKSVTENESSP
jgi:hypothetical protein